MKIYRDTVYALMETGENFKLEGIHAENYTDFPEVIEQINQMEGWFLLKSENGKMIDTEKGAYESKYFFKDTENNTFVLDIDWENSGGIPCLDNLKGNEIIKISQK